MLNMIYNILGLFVFCFMQSSYGYGIGPPFSTCLTLFPKHGGLEAQTTKPPYIVTTQETTYSPGQEIHLRVRGKNGRQFTGLQIAVHRDKGDTEEFIGKFTEFPTHKLKTLNCIDGEENMVAHKNNDLVNEVNITWTAPASNEGNLTFDTSIVENYDVFWINIESKLPAKIDVPIKPVFEVYKGGEINLDFGKCGESMGCVLYPYYCTGDNCDAGATFKEEGNRTRFQLFAKNTHGYISIGLSDDRIMGGDHTITCTLSEDQYTVQHGYNPALFNYRQYKKNEIQDMTVAYKDGKLYCEFTRPSLMSVVNMFKPSERLTFDLKDDYFVMIAWGYSHKGSPAVTHHIELPFTTENKVNFRSNEIYRASALPHLTQAHGLLMIISWIMFAGTVTIVARYFKSSFGEKLVFGAKVWFQTHRSVAILTMVLTSVSFIIIFVKVDGLTEVAEAHAYVGIALMCLTTIQILSGMFRPDPKSSLRPVFNWLHWLVGKTAHILAAVAIILAYNIKFIPKTQSLFGIIITVIWIICQILWELFFEFRTRRRESTETKDTIHLQKADLVLLVAYVINMVLVLSVSVMAIYFF